MSKIISDEEVGELWRESYRVEDIADGAIKRLIRKLVKEREYNLCLVPHKSHRHIEQALRDFHIDPKTWEVKDE